MKILNLSCMLSPKGIETFGKQRYGVIVGESRDGACWKVKWANHKSIDKYHKSFIAIDTSEAKKGILEIIRFLEDKTPSLK